MVRLQILLLVLMLYRFSTVNAQITPMSYFATEFAVKNDPNNESKIELLKSYRKEIESLFSSPSGTSKISSNDGGAFIMKQVINVPELPSESPSFTASADQLVLNPTAVGFIQLFFSTQDILSDDFTGNLVSFMPVPEYSVRYARESESPSVGLIIDNSVDSANPIGPFYIDPTEINGHLNNPNRSLFAASVGPLVIASVSSVPEPSGISLIAISGCFCLHRWRGTKPK